MSDFKNLALVDPEDAVGKLKALREAEELMSSLQVALTEAHDIYANMDGVGVLGTEVANTIEPILPLIKPIALAIQTAADNADAACKSAIAQLQAVGRL